MIINKLELHRRTQCHLKKILRFESEAEAEMPPIRYEDCMNLCVYQQFVEALG